MCNYYSIYENVIKGDFFFWLIQTRSAYKITRHRFCHIWPGLSQQCHKLSKTSVLICENFILCFMHFFIHLWKLKQSMAMAISSSSLFKRKQKNTLKKSLLMYLLLKLSTSKLTQMFSPFLKLASVSLSVLQPQLCFCPRLYCGLCYKNVHPLVWQFVV